MQRLSWLIAAVAAAGLLWWLWPAPVGEIVEAEQLRQRAGVGRLAPPVAAAKPAPIDSGGGKTAQSPERPSAVSVEALRAVDAPMPTKSECDALAPDVFARLPALDDLPAFRRLLSELLHCGARQPMPRPSVSDLELWMMRVGDDPRLLQSIAEYWAGYGRFELAHELVASVAPEQRTARGWMTLAQTSVALIDLNKPMGPDGREKSEQALVAWLQAFESGVPELAYMQLEVAKLQARLGHPDEAIRRSELALASLLQGDQSTGLSPAMHASQLYHAAEVYVALDQPELAVAYMNQADSLVADDPERMDSLRARRRWIEERLPVFLGKPGY